MFMIRTTIIPVRSISLRSINKACHFRKFHTSRSNQLISEALQLSHDAFQGVHTISGLSWHTSIPLTALLFRVAWLPIQYLTGRNQQRQQSYSPLLLAWRKVYQKQAIDTFPKNDEAAAKQAERWVQNKLLLKNRQLTRKYKTMGLRTPIILQLSFLPIWILNADVIRRMSGDGRTILGMLSGSETGSSHPIIPQEHGLLTDQFLWLPDLVSGDPLWVLPCIFGVLQVTNIWNATGKSIMDRRAKYAAGGIGMTTFRERITASISELFLAMAVLSPMILIRSETSSAIVLFLIGSVATQMSLKPLLRISMGWKKGIEPAIPKLPRLKAEYADKEIPPKKKGQK